MQRKLRIMLFDNAVWTQRTRDLRLGGRRFLDQQRWGAQAPADTDRLVNVGHGLLWAGSHRLLAQGLAPSRCLAANQLIAVGQRRGGVFGSGGGSAWVHAAWAGDRIGAGNALAGCFSQQG